MAPSSSPLSSQTPARIADLDLAGARAATADCPAPLPPVPAYRQAGRLQVLQTAVIEAGLMVGLAALALAVRLPDYMLIPPFTDELDEVYRGYLITQGKLYPLTNVDSYMGSMWNWMAAGALWVSGFRLGAPRTLVLILGVLAVLATYLLGRAWGGRRGGLVAAYLVVTAGAHIVINSHIAWSNCLTPLFSTLGVVTLFAATTGQPWRPSTAIVLSGLSWGLALQTHPSVVTLFPGVAIFLVWRGHALFRKRSLYVAAGVATLVNFNLILYNLTTGFETLVYSKNMAARYSGYQELTLPLYVERLPRLGLELLQTLGGAVDLRETDQEFLFDIALWPASLLATIGVVWQWRRGNPLPALLVAGPVFMIPLFNPKYNLLMNGRYLVPLLPILFACIGALSTAIHNRLEQVREDGSALRSAVVQLGPLVLDLATVFLVLHPLFYLSAYYAQAPHIPYSNELYFQGMDELKAQRQNGESVIIDDTLRFVDFWRAAGGVEAAFRLGLSLEGVPNRTVKLDGTTDLLNPAVRCRDQIVILAPRLTDRNDSNIATLGLLGLDHSPEPPSPPEDGLFGLYRLDRLLAAPASC